MRSIPGLDDETNLRDGLHLDSLDMVSLVLQIEVRLQVHIDSSELDGVTKVGDLLNLLQTKLAGASDMRRRCLSARKSSVRPVSIRERTTVHVGQWLPRLPAGGGNSSAPSPRMPPSDAPLGAIPALRDNPGSASSPHCRQGSCVTRMSRPWWGWWRSCRPWPCHPCLGTDFTRWGVLAAPRLQGRLSGARHAEQFRRMGSGGHLPARHPAKLPACGLQCDQRGVGHARAELRHWWGPGGSGRGLVRSP